MLKLLLVTICFGLTLSRQAGRDHGGYKGVIKENAVEGDEVELEQPLNVRSIDGKDHLGDICGYTVYKASSEELPFKVVVADDKAGVAKIIVAAGAVLDHEMTPVYTFEVAAHSCTGDTQSKRERVHIEVEDVNEFTPEWPQSSYNVDVSEGATGHTIFHLHASDKDGQSKICRYDLITPDVPFTVDSQGDLQSTAVLDYNKRSSYQLEVVAEDCGGLRSNKVTVNVEVKTVCRNSWTGVPDRVEFTPHESRQSLVPHAELELCEDVKTCNLSHVSVSVKLSTSHIGKGCDRDTYSLKSQRKLCGASDNSIDLLPHPNWPTLSPGSISWTSSLPTDDGHESDQIFALDGRNTAIEVPTDTIDPHLGDKFTISTWMKHEEGLDESSTPSRGAKEHVLCHSDGDGMNRHHYSVFVHNCRLVLLLRREAMDGVDHDTVYPTEWRWKLPEVCDAKWHHYAISVEFPNARLHIDGRQFVESKRNPDIVDDWSLKDLTKVHFTKLVVGACWMGEKQKMGQFFKGYLAGLSILKNKTESDSVIQCLNNCQEKLDFSGIEEMDTGMSVSMNNEMSSITISGTSLNSVQKLLHRIGYVNTRQFPTPGHRPFSLTTHAVCSDGSKMTVDPVKSLILVTDVEKPVISLSAVETVICDEHKVSRGEQIYHNLHINVHTANEKAEMMMQELSLDSSSDKDPQDSSSVHKSLMNDKYRLDSCLILVAPPMNLHVEHLKYPENLVKMLGLQVDISEDGLVIAGADRLDNYEEVLSQIQYVSSHPGDVNYRKFVLTCTELNGRFVSNQLQVKIELMHAHHDRPTVAAAAVQVNKIHAVQSDIHLDNRDAESFSKRTDSQTVTGIVVMCIVCCAFVTLIVVLGVLRIRNTRRHSVCRDSGSADDRLEMEWDHSALTITVNPMDQETVYKGIAHEAGAQGEDECLSDDDDDASYPDNEVMTSDEEEIEQTQVTTEKNKNQLEWDDSTLSF